MIYVLLTDGFEEIEAIEPIDILRRGGAEVKTVGVSGKNVTGAHGITVEADILPNEVRESDMELLVLPGGPGHKGIEKNSRCTELISYAYNNNIYLAAICASPSILGRAGLLKGKKATCFPGFEKYLDGAEYVSDKAVQDGRIITARGAGAAADFGFMLLSALKGSETANKIKSDMQYL